jgi:hypothetical protein
MSFSIYVKFENPSLASVSTTGPHAGEFEVLGWSHGSRDHVKFTRYTDAVSLELMQLAWYRKGVGKVTFRHDGDATRSITITLERVVVSNFNISPGQATFRSKRSRSTTNTSNTTIPAIRKTAC